MAIASAPSPSMFIAVRSRCAVSPARPVNTCGLIARRLRPRRTRCATASRNERNSRWLCTANSCSATTSARCEKSSSCEVGVEVAVVVVPAAGLGVAGRASATPMPGDDRRLDERPVRVRGDRVGTSGSISTVQWQCGIRSAGTRGGRWTGRTCARGFVAPAVASKVGSSIAWHMPWTYSSPIGSTSMSAPQCASQNSPWFSSNDLGSGSP